MAGSDDDALERILRPLRFARSLDNPSIVKDLEGAVLRGVARALEESPGDAGRLRRIAALAAGLDALGGDEKRLRIDAILEDRPAPPIQPGPGVPSSPRARSAAKRVPIEEARPEDPLERITGVGPKTAERYAELGMKTVADALLFLPRRFEDRSSLSTIADLVEGQSATIRGTILSLGARPIRGGRRMFEMVVSDGTSRLACHWFRFRQVAFESKHRNGQRVRISGKVSSFGARIQMVHPDVEVVEDDGDAGAPGVLPIYGDVPGVPPKKVRAIAQGLARAAAPHLTDFLPDDVRERQALGRLDACVRAMHLPEPGRYRADEASVRRRLVFDELFVLMLALLRTRWNRDREPGLSHPAGPWDAFARELFPFELTKAQARVAAEIAADLADERPMNRLLQGDVGSGKTAVALLAAAIVRRSGRQAVLLAPTEILAAQHQRSAQRYLEPRNIRCALLTGSTRAALRREILGGVQNQTIDLLIGTHAVLEEDVVFHDLGLAVVDEQHRFGVEQRAVLRAKARGRTPDVLVMTATPIPRTLALTLYGDLRVSVLDEMPPGRKGTVTRVFAKRRREAAFAVIDAELASGRQAYVVFPLVEASDELDLEAATDAALELEARFAPHRVALLHGRMRSDEKHDAMQRFVRGEVAVLVSTTVVEVGVDVANASVMAVMDAERFGLSQLHQLRGRIGRGEHPGTCLLIAGDVDQERLRVLESTSDGFEVAERDLEIRGPGEILGTKQHGLPELTIADLARDQRILELARSEAERLIAADPELSRAEHFALADEIRRRFQGRFDLVKVG
jgi:ATP-dependent DNA helicase RecG